jgi:hypothetical protein
MGTGNVKTFPVWDISSNQPVFFIKFVAVGATARYGSGSIKIKRLQLRKLVKIILDPEYRRLKSIGSRTLKILEAAANWETWYFINSFWSYC